ncbi:putative membrane protein YfcA [Methanolinea mesophila]|uniref:sulfite exporter TauE/SafE family protein n=1 Tax=Methanolinea mesophila TaxID=547055 RepID=UPI001AEA0950|nr:sulfite exporter TauE/SafE family protein [Methanolinea mesophila]MBP1927561.1 putative membrane protein YfcA [Methanolinea mesophila]
MIAELILGVAISLVIGIIAALVGLGGGFLYVPTLILLFGLDTPTAIGTSLTIIVFTMLSSSITYARQRRIFYRSAMYLIIPSVIFSFIGASLTAVLPVFVITVVFIVVLFLVGLKMIFPGLPQIFPLTFGPCSDEVCVDRFSNRVTNRLYYAHVLVWGSVAGMMSGLTGVGGGVINVPALVMMGMPVHFAVATSTFVILFTAISASLVHIRLGNVSLEYTAVYSVGAIIGAQIGARIAPAIHSDQLKKLVGVVLLLTSILVLVREITGM